MRGFGAGDTVRFRYARGSRPGQYRIVKVGEQDGQGFKGTDLEAEGFRNYADEAVSDLKVVARAGTDVVPASTLVRRPEAHKPESLIRLFKDADHDWTAVRYDAAFQALVVTRTPKFTATLENTPAGVRITIRDAGGKTAAFPFTFHVVRGVMRADTPVADLKAVLNAVARPFGLEVAEVPF